MSRPLSLPVPEAQDPHGFRLLFRTFTGRVLLILLVLKTAILILNAATYPTARQYDLEHHSWRARSAGLEMGRMAYNPPLYYLPLLPLVDLSRFYKDGKAIIDLPVRPKEKARNIELLSYLKWGNVGYVFGAYLVWIVGILPRVASSRKAWFLSSFLLLALPGYQKAAVMAHPDVLLLFLASLTFYLTLAWMNRAPKAWRHIVLAVVAGLTGACRPFAVVPLLACWFLNVGMLAKQAVAQRRAGRSRAGVTLRLSGMVLVVSLVSATIAAGWWGFRYAKTGEIMNAYNAEYMAPYLPHRKGFDYKHYYASLYPKELLKVPSRADVGVRPSRAPSKSNSFFTQLYSEFWGDHYLYFSASRNFHDTKVWVKRVLFVLALPLTLLMVLGIVTGTLRTAFDAIKRRALVHPGLVMAGIFWVGFALFMYWQGGAGLLPGKNSTIKFLYIAWLVPFGIGTAASQPIGRVLFWILLACEIAVALAAFPMSQAWA